MTPQELAQQRIDECRRTHAIELDLTGCNLEAIPDQVFELTWLEKLNVCGWGYYGMSVGGKIQEIPSGIKNLKLLKKFDCSFNEICFLELNNFPNLEVINCSTNRIDSLDVNNLPNLNFLDCSYNTINNLRLDNLFNLIEIKGESGFESQHLMLSDLPKLQSIDCGESHIEFLEFNNCPNLQIIYCQESNIFDLVLRKLPQLEELHCHENKLSKLELKALEKLQFVSCRLNQLNRLILKDLPNLRHIECDNNKLHDISQLDSFLTLKNLETLGLYNNKILNAPLILFGENFDYNCIQDIKNYRQAILEHGSTIQQQLKVQLVGNGRVGKTTLAYALEHKQAPNEQFKSTHGIVINEIQQLLDGEDKPITLQLWDFGGQEIYHATHRMFLSNDCLYMLLWAEETEEHPDETCHPVSYWLELIKDLGKGSPIVLVKNQIDRSDRLPTRPPELTDDMPGVKQIRQEVKISAMQYRGMPALRGAIESVIEELKHQICLELPTSWLQVQRELKQLDQNTIPFAYFKQLCIKAGIDHAEWFVGYLHKTGVLFYQQGAFQDQIILNQDWAIKAVYRVFDPQDQRSFIEDDLKGRFKGRHAKTVWPDVDETEREIYLDFMRNCGICYEPNRKHDTPFADRTFIIPALLPEESTARAAWHKSDKDWQLDIEYPFLHRSIIERIILRLGETYQGEPWRTGIFCNTEHGQVLLECVYRDKQQSTQGQLSFHLRGNQLDHLVYALRKLVSKISPHRRYQEFLSKSSETRIQLLAFKENSDVTTSLDEVKQVKEPIHIFISYSKHDKEPFRIKMERCLKNISRDRELPLVCWHDECLLSGGLVHDDILEQLERADIVVLLLSPDFIATDYCFDRELPKALQRYEQKQNVVIPVVIRETPGWMNYKIGNRKLGDLTALPTKGVPMEDWPSHDKFWGNVEQGIRERVRELIEKRG
jgi:small GTP-binding protein